MHAEPTRPALAPTGDARVDHAIEGLADLDQIDLDERPAVLEEVHDRLREILGELGDSGRPGQSGQQGVLPAGPAPRPDAPRPGAPRPGPPGPLGSGAPRPGGPDGGFGRRPDAR